MFTNNSKADKYKSIINIFTKNWKNIHFSTDFFRVKNNYYHNLSNDKENLYKSLHEHIINISNSYYILISSKFVMKTWLFVIDFLCCRSFARPLRRS